jgi:hypothetical protein
MINLDFSSAIAWFVTTVIGTVFCLWLFGRRQKEKDLLLDDKFLWFCSVCTYTYISTTEGVISVCPRCGSYNKKQLT